MKKKIQKYLSGEREGFSLVELIIVIAIMAILIGVVALAVIPYLEQSRVSKDQQTVDSVYGAFQSAIANQQITDNIQVEIAATSDVGGSLTSSAEGTGFSDGGVKFAKFMAKALNATDTGTTAAAILQEVAKGTANKLESSNAKGSSIICKFNKASGEISVWASGTVNTDGSAKDGGEAIISSNKTISADSAKKLTPSAE